MENDTITCKLPEGEFSTWSPDEYQFTCFKCGKEKKATWNIVKKISNCWSCGHWICGERNFLFYVNQGKSSEQSFSLELLRKKPVPDRVNRNYLINAWDSPASREFLIGRNINEFVSRDVNIQYFEEKKTLYLETRPLSKDLGASYIWRQIPGGKWYHRKSTKSIYYSWGIEKYLNSFGGSKRDILICEGVFDLLSTRMYRNGIAVLGSNLNDIWYPWLKKRANKLVLWFDNDDAGHKATMTIAKKCEYYNIPYSVILSTKDPKCYDRRIPSNREFLDSITTHLNSKETGIIIKDECANRL